ncbi:lipoprotein signal peptidase [Gynurincola endophyticus]|uniref:lipoprotein signal peptidase n=1 Tax=Gynurincola endophyticus TaxID=2479004 RepID=UPI000F8D0F84|nr:lipoprotein signal peptidase [Gynurincola endophyticus]
MKLRTIWIIIFSVLIIDQALKIWVKTSMGYGEQIPLLGSWFRLLFIENEGMAWGWKFGGEFGKLALTLFRLVAVAFGTWFIFKNYNNPKYHKGFFVCVALMYAGAAGNLIDSIFYGVIFAKSGYGLPLATMFPPEGGYATLFHGKVVDMLYMPIIENKVLPEWIPIWGGERFTFFSPIFNIADASISLSIIFILIFQKKFFKETKETKKVQQEKLA